MKIKCPDCHTSYDVKPELLGQKGRSVKCVRCGGKWFVMPDHQDGDPDLEPQDDGIQDFSSETWTDDLDEIDASVSERQQPPAPPKRDQKTIDVVPSPVERPSSGPSGKPEPPEQTKPSAGSDETPKPVDIETLANRPRVKVNPDKYRRNRLGAAATWVARRNYRRIGGVALFAFAIALTAFLLTIRTDIVRAAPDLASLFDMIGLDVNLRGLEFENLRTFAEQDQGRPVLVVEGSIRNIEKTDKSIPAVRLSIRGTDLQEIYAWTVEPRTEMLSGLDETRFRSILPDPPPGANDIQVRFVDRQPGKTVVE
ncbi:zinc-ribbon domain-containing protein [Roseibium sp. RKSG952]|uniref:zinc-ribbon domain-containing protein n=1 Tax=Roseibium sp. RKSG952 TaxID=2529384 RepID=UPI0012BB89BE|nr:zinc-ribbon domain-containing protein [Roseibium sp. RKSG952]MTH96455.1 thioredoxin [Roseibium sp. RKSG952]